MQVIKSFVCLGAVLSVTGCANIVVPAPQPTAANVTAAKKLPQAVKMGTFKAASTLSASADQSISVRGSNTLKAPAGQGFSGYLRDVLATDLRAAGKLDEGSPIAISGELTQSELDAGMSVGTGKLSARLLVTRNNTVCLDKSLTASSQWESSFMAAVAVPTAFNQYSALFPELAGKLLKDADFLSRCAGQ